MKELDNFIFKFLQLRRSGFTAHLDIDTHAGQAWVGLRVLLNPLQQQNHHQSPVSRNRSPSYFRRQERRKAARAAAETSSQHSGNKAAEANSVLNSDVNKDSNVKTSAEKVDITEEAKFECDLCDFVSNRQTGLRIHYTRKHAMIEQLDGNTEVEIALIDESWEKDLVKHDKFIEGFLMTGDVGESTDLYEIETLQFVLSPHSNLCRFLTSEQRGNEVLLAMDSYRRNIDAKFGPGAFLQRSPWQDFVG